MISENLDRCPTCGGLARDASPREHFQIRHGEDLLSAIMRFTGVSFPDAVHIAEAAHGGRLDSGRQIRAASGTYS
jgi:hypothetical protein